MKNFLMAFMVMGAFLMTSCGGDDGDCKTCTFSLLGIESSNEYCDLGDGTFTIDGGAAQTGDFDQIIETQELLGTCE